MAVVAVDPSSPITGGALLGDRVRMQAYAGDRRRLHPLDGRPRPRRRTASTTGAAAAVLDAAGFDLVFVETVGTGQSEVEVAAAADTTVVLEAPEMGDEVQAIKAGLLEVADLVVVNKGDKPGAQRTAAQLRAMLVAVRRRRPTTARGRRARPAPAEAARGPDHDGRDRRRRPGAARRARPATGPAVRRPRPRPEPRARPGRGAGLGDRRRPPPRTGSRDGGAGRRRDGDARRGRRPPSSIRTRPPTRSWRASWATTGAGREAGRWSASVRSSPAPG